MYFGEAQTVLDDKGRITIPRRIRETMEVLGHGVWYLTRGFDHAVFLFPREEWDRIRNQAAKYPSMDGKALDFRRLFFGSVAEAKPDRQGRMPVASHLRQYADIDREAVLIGVDDHLELWSRKGWSDFQESKDSEFKKMATDLFVPQGGPELEAKGLN